MPEPSAEDTLAALAGDRFVRLRGRDRDRACKAAREELERRHAGEYRELLDREAARILAERDKPGLWR